MSLIADITISSSIVLIPFLSPISRDVLHILEIILGTPFEYETIALIACSLNTSVVDPAAINLALI